MTLRNREIDNDYFFVTKRLISIFNAPVKFNPFFMLHHPGYPGLLSIKDALVSMGFSVEGYFIHDRDLYSVPTHAVIHLQGSEGDRELVIIKGTSQDKVEIDTFRRGRISLTLAEFREMWDGNFLTVDFHREELSLPDVALNERSIRMLLLGLFITTFLSVIFTVSPRVLPTLYLVTTVTSIIGLSVSLVLLMKQLGLKSISLVDRFCEHDGFSCASVLGFNDKNILFGLTWSEAGLIYFSGLIIAQISSLLITATTAFMLVLAWLSMLTLPVIIYGIHLQMNVIKKWCSLCLIVHTMLVANVVVGTRYMYLSWNMDRLTFLPVMLCSFLSAGLAWFIIKHFLYLESIAVASEEKSAIFRSNLGYFDHLMASQPNRLSTLPMTDMQWGMVDARIQVLGILSFDCNFCYTVGRELMLLRNILGDDNLRLEIMFFTKDTNSLEPLLADMLCKTTEQDILFERWLKMEGSQQDSEKRKMTEEHGSFLTLIRERRLWLAENNIKNTPKVFINGVLVGDGLSPMDFVYYLRKKTNYGNDAKNVVDIPTTLHTSVN